MTFKNTKLTLAVALVAFAALLFAGLTVQAKGPAEHSRADVETFVDDGLYESVDTVGFSNLVRKSDGIQLQLKTSELIEGGVYTYWILADEDGVDEALPFDLIIWGDYVVVKKNGKATANLSLKTGMAGIAGNPTVHLDEGAPGLNNPYGAGIEIELVYHGQEADIPDDPDVREAWFTTFWIGDEAVCTVPASILPPGFPPIPTDTLCPLAQLTFHAP